MKPNHGWSDPIIRAKRIAGMKRARAAHGAGSPTPDLDAMRTRDDGSHDGGASQLEAGSPLENNGGHAFIITGAASPDKQELLPMRPQLSTDEAWEQLEGELARSIADLDDDEFLIITRKDRHYFVQFAGQGGFGMRVEAVSNAYLKIEEKLSKSACAKLVTMGWNPPCNPPEGPNGEGHKPDGSPNYFLDIGLPVLYDRVATLAVRTLREVHAVMHPGGLRYKAFGNGGCEIRFPNLRIARER